MTEHITSTASTQFLEYTEKLRTRYIGYSNLQWNHGEDDKYVRALFSGMYDQFMWRVRGHGSRYWDRRHPRWDGGEFGGTKYPNIWQTIATHFARNDLPAFAEIDAVFRSCSRDPPDPDALIRGNNSAGLLKYLAKKVTSEQLRLRSELNRFIADVNLWTELYPDDNKSLVY